MSNHDVDLVRDLFSSLLLPELDGFVVTRSQPSGIVEERSHFLSLFLQPLKSGCRGMKLGNRKLLMPRLKARAAT